MAEEKQEPTAEAIKQRKKREKDAAKKAALGIEKFTVEVARVFKPGPQRKTATVSAWIKPRLDGCRKTRCPNCCIRLRRAEPMWSPLAFIILRKFGITKRFTGLQKGFCNTS